MWNYDSDFTGVSQKSKHLKNLLLEANSMDVEFEFSFEEEGFMIYVKQIN